MKQPLNSNKKKLFTITEKKTRAGKVEIRVDKSNTPSESGQLCGSINPNSSEQEGQLVEKKQHSSVGALCTDSILEIVERSFSYRFKQIELLNLALTHRSMRSISNGLGDYERLEFLGDAVLDLAMSHLLIEIHPNASEGNLSKMRAALVNSTTLGEIGREIEIGFHIKLSRSELAAGGADRTSTLADVMEAIFGAIYKEAGLEAAITSVRKLFLSRISEVSTSDPKTDLQELLHAQGRGLPRYILEVMEGPEHNPTFISAVEIDGEIVGRGRGKTKKLSQQKAASEALEKLR